MLQCIDCGLGIWQLTGEGALAHLELIDALFSSSITETLRGRPFHSWGGGKGDFWSSRIFFSSNLVGRIFFSLLNALQDIFFPPHFSSGFFSSKKGHVFTYPKCIYIVVIAVIIKCCRLYKIIIV